MISLSRLLRCAFWSFAAMSYREGRTLGSSDTNTETNVEENVDVERSPEPAASVSGASETEPLIRRDELLSPDDPKVSVMNLYRIRALRFAIWIMWIVNAGMFFLMLLSEFISIPGLNNRGQSYLELDLVVISALTNLVTLWWFSVPAYLERMVGYITAALVGIDFLVVEATPLRREFGAWGGILVVWTLVTVVINCLADYWLERGKIYQEIRYTGRPELRKTVTEMAVIAVKFVVKVVMLVLVWNLSLRIWLDAFDTHEAPLGDMVPVNNNQFRVHLWCNGDVHENSTQPTYLIEGGQLTSSEDFQEWLEEMFHSNKVQRYCVWDRPGYGFSDSAPSPTSVSIVADYLLEALHAQDIRGPYGLVAFDLGGLYARVLAAKIPDSVSSIVLVDSWHEDLLKLNPFTGPHKKPQDPSAFTNMLELMTPLDGFKLWLKGVISPFGFVTNWHWFLHPKTFSSKARVYGRDMVYQPQYLRARLQEQITASVLSYNEVAGASVRDIPLYVMSSQYMIKRSPNWGRWQRLLTQMSDQCEEWVVVEGTSHFIHESAKGRRQLQELMLRVVVGGGG